jgi:hypothetical protein
MRSYSGIVYNKKEAFAVCSSFLLELDLWLVGWFVVWLVDWLIGWLVGWLTGFVLLFSWLVGGERSVFGSLVGRSVHPSDVRGRLIF